MKVGAVPQGEERPRGKIFAGFLGVSKFRQPAVRSEKGSKEESRVKFLRKGLRVNCYATPVKLKAVFLMIKKHITQ